LFLALLALAYGWLFNWSERLNNPNEMVRVHTVAALADHGTYAIARRETNPSGGFRDEGAVRERLGAVADRSLACDDRSERPPLCAGSLYAAKAPGLAVLGVPPYLAQKWLWRLLGQGEPSRPALVWWLRCCCVVVPTIFAWLGLARHLHRTLDCPPIGLAVALAGALGSLSLTYGQMFAGHQPAGLALVLSFGCVVRAGAVGRPGAVVASGLAAGSAVAIEYPACGAALVLLAWLLVRRRSAGDLGLWVAGAAAPLLLLLHFHTLAFGAPWRLPYAHLEDPGFGAAQARGLFGVTLPDRDRILGSLVSPETGLYFFAPWTALAWLGIGGLAGKRSAPFWLDRRAEGIVAWCVCLYYLWVQSSYEVWRGGWVVGPRHLTAFVPFAALAAAHGLDALPARLARLGIAMLAVLGPASIAITGIASAVSQGFPETFSNPLREAALPLLGRGFVAANPLMLVDVPGPWSALPYFVALSAGALWLVWLLVAEGTAPHPCPRRALCSTAALALSAALVVGFWQLGRERSAETDRELGRVMAAWWPPAPPGSRPLDPG
jgi:hypothetical protein